MSWPPTDGTPYRPYSGTDGACFYERWCADCKRDEAYRRGDWGDGCRIAADTFVYDVNDPKYPREWVWQDGAPTCTAFVHMDEPDPRITDEERAAQMALPLNP